MPQITLYLDSEAIRVMRGHAAAEQIPYSRWVSSLIRRQSTETWHAGITVLFGQFRDIPRPDRPVFGPPLRKRFGLDAHAGDPQGRDEQGADGQGADVRVAGGQGAGGQVAGGQGADAQDSGGQGAGRRIEDGQP